MHLSEIEKNSEYDNAFSFGKDLVKAINASDMKTKFILVDYSKFMDGDDNKKITYIKDECKEIGFNEKQTNSVIVDVDNSPYGIKKLNEPKNNGVAFSSFYGNSEEKLYFIGFSRDFNQSNELKKYHQTDVAKSMSVKEQDLIIDCVAHEIGHGILNRENSFYHPHSKYEKECGADAFSALIGIRNRKNTSVAKIMANIRALSYESAVKNRLESYKERPSKLETKLKEAGEHYTTDVINGIINFADEKMKTDKDYFSNLSINDIATLANDMVKKHRLSYEQYSELAVAVMNNDEKSAEFQRFQGNLKNARKNPISPAYLSKEKSR